MKKIILSTFAILAVASCAPASAPIDNAEVGGCFNNDADDASVCPEQNNAADGEAR